MNEHQVNELKDTKAKAVAVALWERITGSEDRPGKIRYFSGGWQSWPGSNWQPSP